MLEIVTSEAAVQHDNQSSDVINSDQTQHFERSLGVRVAGVVVLGVLSWPTSRGAL